MEKKHLVQQHRQTRMHSAPSDVCTTETKTTLNQQQANADSMGNLKSMRNHDDVNESNSWKSPLLYTKCEIWKTRANSD